MSKPKGPEAEQTSGSLGEMAILQSKRDEAKQEAQNRQGREELQRISEEQKILADKNKPVLRS